MEGKKLGLIVNPVAGLGGSVGLKGTDGMVQEALRRGAEPQAEVRARTALTELLPLRESITIYTGSGPLGGDLAQELGFNCERMACSAGETSAEDTVALVKWLQEEKMDLIVFAGGDGTARDICAAAKEDAVFLGIPAGVKIHSPVYARSPLSAGQLACLFLQEKTTATHECEVLDINEEHYRNEMIDTKLYGYLRIPKDERFTQNKKSGTPASEEESILSIAARVVDDMEDGVFYLIGAGTTTRAVMQELELPNTLIGVDLVRDRQLVENDVYGKRILDLTAGSKVKLVVTVTGGQGFLFGRGNQQLTPEVLRAVGKENLIILATKEKIFRLKGQPLLVDTGDAELDKMLSGYYQVICDYNETILCKVAAG